jgi:polar amino acid transport system substrate-binding protein
MISLILATLLSVSVSAADKVVELTSLDWPPYSGKSLKEQGASVAVAKAAFKAMGYELKVSFYPWNRAVALAKDTSSSVAGYFPEYYSDDIAKEFTFSGPMGTGPLGFAERKDKPVSWSTLDDLKAYSIGVVQGYVNTAKFDAMVASKALKSSTTISDVNNLKKLAAGRIDLAVVDKNVMNFLLKTDKQLSSSAGKLQFNSTLLEDKKLYICFKNTAEGKKLADIYNQGLKKIDIQAIMAQHL